MQLVLRFMTAVLVLTGAAAAQGCYEDALICPNGTAVARDPVLGCAFAKCVPITAVPTPTPRSGN